MLTASEYIETKSRMLLAAEASGLIARTGDNVRFDEETYPLVLEALSRNKEDVRRILAECDILRHMSHQSLFPAAGEAHANDDGANDRGTVDPLPLPPDEGRRDEVPADNAGNGGEVQAGGADGGSKVPKPRRNRKRKATSPEPVERADADGAVGGTEG